MDTMATWNEQTPLVGRDRELTTLAGLLEKARRGHSGVALVAGEPGIGKTRLLLEFARRARADDWHVLLGRAYESEGMPPYLPFSEALRDYLRTCRPDEARAYLEGVTSDTFRLLPDLASRLAPSPAGAGVRSPDRAQRDPEGERYRLFESFCGVLLNIARSPPGGLLVCLDDLHWADPPTLQLLLHLARKLDEAPVLLVCSYRSTASGGGQALLDALAELSRERLRQRLVLSALSRDELGTLVTSLSGAAAPAVLDIIHGQTGGNPFFVRELVRHLQDQGHDLSCADLATADWGVPAGVHQVIGTRLTRLSRQANQVLQAGAVLGEPLAASVLGAMLDLEAAYLLDALDEVVRAGLVREEGEQYHFSHALVRQTVYRGLTVARRQHLHLAAAAALERVHGLALERHLGELAVHYARAGDFADPDKTIAYAERAGEAAKAVFAYEEATAHWRTALEWMDRHAVELGRRARLLERLGDLTYLAGIDYDAGIAYLQRALQLYEQLGQADRVAHVHSRLGSALSTLPESWDLPRAVHHYRCAEAILAAGPPSSALGYVYAGLAQVAVWDVRIQDGLDASAKALDIAERVRDELLWAHAAATRGAHLFSSGQASEGLGLMHRAWQTADRLNDPVVFFTAFLGSAFAHWIGDPTELKLWCDRELARPRLRHAPGQRKRFLARLGAAHALVGDLQLARSLVSTVDLTYDAWEMLFWLGEWELCEALASRRVEASQRGGERAFAFEATYDLARLRRAQGEVERAGTLLDQALAVAIDGGERSYELAVRSLLAQVCAETDRLPEARQQLGQARTIAGNGDEWRGLAGQLHLAEGVVALAAAASPEAGRHFQRCIDVYRCYAFPWGEAEAQLLWGRGLRNAGETASATQKLRAAEDIYRRCGAGDVWLERLAREREPQQPAGYPNGLSQREVEVLRLVAAGKTNQQIADELVISLNTVARHVSNIFGKTGVANRAEAASYAHSRGLVASSLTRSC
jgi:DNA-binding CsgD family transcriptional regulator/tetratricopeptide (TPR) repeat protein